jgi:diacylglycerol kinase family enzyme
MCILEKGAIDDGHLDLYAVPAQSLGSLLTLGPALRHGRMRGLKNVLTLEGSEIRIHTRHSKTVTADGESATQTPAVFRVLPGALSVYSTPARGTRP